MTAHPRHAKAKLLSLGDVHLPYPERKNPHLFIASRATKRLAQSAGILSKPLEPYFDEFVDLAAQFYPDATEEGLVQGALLVSWLFFLDDTYDRDAAFASDVGAVKTLMEQTLGILSGQPLPEAPTPLHRYTLAFREQLKGSSPRWLARFLESVRSYLFQGSLEAVESWQGVRFPSIEQYITRRIQDSGVLPCLDLVELVSGHGLAEPLFRHPALQRMRHLCARVIAHENDIVSYENEVVRRDKPNNLVRLMMHHQQLTFAEAVSATVELIHGDVKRFERLGRWLLLRHPEAAVPLGAYVKGMQAQMRGNHDWSLVSRRYSSPTSPFPELCRPV